MPDTQALEFLRRCLSSFGGAAEWNNYRARNGPFDLTQADLRGADLKNYNFSRCNLNAAQFFNADLSGADLTEANLSYANLQRVNLANAYLAGANLQVAQLQGANVVNASLERADLRAAHARGAYFTGSDLSGADLSGADFRGAALKFAKVTGANVQGMKVEDADLTGVEFTPEQIQALHGYARAVIGRKTTAQRAEEERRKKRIAPEESYDDLFREEDCYKILGISAGAALEEIERAYRARAKEYHPDRVAALGEKLRIVAEREFQRIQHAYRSLTQHRARPAAQVAAAGGARAPAKKPSEWTLDECLAFTRVHPENPDAFYNLGVKYFQRGDYEKAIECYQKTLQIHPRHADAAHNLKVAQLARILQQP